MSKECEQAIHKGRYRNHHLQKMLHLINIKTKLDTFHSYQKGKLKSLVISSINKNMRKWEHLEIASGKFSCLFLFGQQLGNIW